MFWSEKTTFMIFRQFYNLDWTINFPSLIVLFLYLINIINVYSNSANKDLGPNRSCNRSTDITYFIYQSTPTLLSPNKMCFSKPKDLKGCTLFRLLWLTFTVLLFFSP